MLWSHRGPDNQSVLKICKSLVFGHTRLSIVDLSNKSNQPMSNDNYFLTFNGEIYNYKELRYNMSKIGVVFSINGDTEVLF